MGNRLDLRGRGTKRGRTSRQTPPVSRSPFRPSGSQVTPPKLDVTVQPQTLADYLGGTAENPAPSKFGGTTLERLVDNAAILAGFEFDAAQVVIQIPMNGSYTRVDRMLLPNKLVYVDGKVHFLRLDAEQQDLIQKNALHDMGYLVYRLKYDALLRDPVGTVRTVLYGIG